jgi:hypothetical protein
MEEPWLAVGSLGQCKRGLGVACGQVLVGPMPTGGKSAGAQRGSRTGRPWCSGSPLGAVRRGCRPLARSPARVEWLFGQQATPMQS